MFGVFQAARYDDLDDVVSLESAGVSLDSKDSPGRTGLFFLPTIDHFIYFLFSFFLVNFYIFKLVKTAIEPPL